jgi:hypothetical protein
MAIKKFSGVRAVWLSLFVFMLCLGGSAILSHLVEPLAEGTDPQARAAMSLLAAVLGMLAGGCIAGLFSFTYGRVEKHEARAVTFIARILIGSMYALVFLAMYCLRRAGAFSSMDQWAVWLLVASVYALLDGVLLLEQWDSTLLD